ncbi:Uncharacterised protein [Vibrio cholerae]|nr:Uncharacterised protein [Vibrio cholerae]
MQYYSVPVDYRLSLTATPIFLMSKKRFTMPLRIPPSLNLRRSNRLLQR